MLNKVGLLVIPAMLVLAACASEESEIDTVSAVEGVETVVEAEVEAEKIAKMKTTTQLQRPSDEPSESRRRNSGESDRSDRGDGEPRTPDGG